MDEQEAKAKYAKLGYHYKQKRHELHRLQKEVSELQSELDNIEETADCNGWNLIQDPVILLQNYENASFQYNIERDNEEKINSMLHSQSACKFAGIDENEIFFAGVSGCERAKIKNEKEDNNA